MVVPFSGAHLKRPAFGADTWKYLVGGFTAEVVSRPPLGADFARYTASAATLPRSGLTVLQGSDHLRGQ
jgi:hypothetical protein